MFSYMAHGRTTHCQYTKFNKQSLLYFTDIAYYVYVFLVKNMFYITKDSLAM